MTANRPPGPGPDPIDMLVVLVLIPLALLIGFWIVSSYSSPGWWLLDLLR